MSVYRARVTRVDASGVSVIVPDLAGSGYEFGPLVPLTGVENVPGDAVVVGSVGDVLDDVVLVAAQGGAPAVSVLDDLDDVIITTPSTGETLIYNGSEWVNAELDLESLSDVDLTSPTLNDYLRFDGSEWVNTPFPTFDLESLTDVDLTSPTTNDYLRYNGSQWVNTPFPTFNLDSLTDVVITAAATGEYLRYNGSNWVDSVIGGADIVIGSGGSDLEVNSTGNINVNSGGEIIFDSGSDLTVTDAVDVNVTNPLAPTSYTPTLTGNVSNPTIGTGANALHVGEYTVDPWTNLVRVNIKVRFGTSGAAAGSGTYNFDMPTAMDLQTDPDDAIRGRSDLLGWGTLRDNSSSATPYDVFVLAKNAAGGSGGVGQVQMVIIGGSFVSATSPFTWAADDGIVLTIIYRKA